MIYLGSERTLTQDYKSHGVAEDYSGFHKSEVKINGRGKVIKVINKFVSHQDSINYNNFLKNQSVWYKNGVYNCVSITGKTVKMTDEELGGNQIWIETYENDTKLILRICHLDSVLVRVNDIVDKDTIIALQGNTGLVASGKSVTDVTYGTHLHFEVTKNGSYINPRKYADGSTITTYGNNSNGINEKNNQIKILVNQINIREQANETSKDIGDVYFDEYYNVLEIVDSTNYTWYKIKTNNNITGYVANLKGSSWIEYIEKEEEIEIIGNDNGKNPYSNQIKILVNQINIREQTDTASKDIGDVYFDEYYNVLDIIDSITYTWYKIKTNNNIIGYVANLKGSNWIEYIEKNEQNNQNLTLIYTAEKTGQYSIRLNAGEKLYVEKP